jgi:hypothetical protein
VVHVKDKARVINRQEADFAHSHQLTRASAGDTASERHLEEVARQINEICRRATFDLAYEIGELIVRKLFGNLSDWNRYGTRHPSYRQLARRGDLLLSPSGLCRSVGVYSICERLGGRGTWKHLSVSHLQEVLPLEDAEQERLLGMAENERWTVSRLRAEVRKFRTRNNEGGRSLHRDVCRVNSLLEKAQSVVTAANSVAALSDRDILELREALRVTRDRCMQLHDAIQQFCLTEDARQGANRASCIRELSAIQETQPKQGPGR